MYISEVHLRGLYWKTFPPPHIRDFVYTIIFVFTYPCYDIEMYNYYIYLVISRTEQTTFKVIVFVTINIFLMTCVCVCVDNAYTVKLCVFFFLPLLMITLISYSQLVVIHHVRRLTSITPRNDNYCAELFGFIFEGSLSRRRRIRLS